MAKMRGVKPEFWTDEKVVEVSPLARLLFIGLWNHACDNGHVEDRPRQLKMRILPADDCDIDDLLAELVDEGMVTRTNGTITVPKLGVHQRLDKRWFLTCDLPECLNPFLTEGDTTGPQRGHAGATKGPRRGTSGPRAERRGDEMRGDEVVDAPAKRASTMPKDWTPNPSAITYATEKGLDLDHEAEQFTNHHLAKGSKFKDWDRAFRTWLGNAAKWQAERTPERRPSDDSWDHLKGDPDAAWNAHVAECNAKGIDPYEAIA